MAINGILGTVSYDDERARGHGHDPVIMSGLVKANQGALPVGLLLSRDSDEKLIPYGEIENESVGTGDGTTFFSKTLAAAPIEPGSVSITDGVESFSDDGFGRLWGSAGGSGWVDYEVGNVVVTFQAAPANAAAITADYARAVEGVLDEAVDTAKTTSATYIVHGSVRRDALKVGAVAQAAPSAAMLKKLAKKLIYAM